MFAANVMAAAVAATIPNGQQEWGTPGTYSYIVPADVTELSAVTVQAGQGGGAWLSGRGGNLRWKKVIPVTPGETLTIFIPAGGAGTTSISFAGAAGGHAQILRGGTVLLSSDSTTVAGDVGGGDGGGGDGGRITSGTHGQPYSGGGGGGAGGYSGNGGKGGGYNGFNGGAYPSEPGQGGGGGGGGSDTSSASRESSSNGGFSYGSDGEMGGGVGLKGEGASGAAGTTGVTATAGGNGSASTGAICGAGGKGGYERMGPGATGNFRGSDGLSGGVRIIHGVNRFYPSTNTGDL